MILRWDPVAIKEHEYSSVDHFKEDIHRIAQMIMTVCSGNFLGR